MNVSINILSIFKNAFLIYRAVFPLFIILGLIYGFTNVVPGFILKLFGVKSIEIQVFLTILLNSWITISIVSASDKIYDKKEVDLKKILLFPRKVYWSYVNVTFMYLMLVIFGAFLLIIPGLYAAIVFTFANIICVLEKREFIECFKSSFRMVKGFFIPVLLFSLISVFFYLLPQFFLSPIEKVSARLEYSVSIILVVFIMPYLTLAQVGFYRQVRSLMEGE